MDNDFTKIEGLAWGKLLSVHASMLNQLEEMLQTQHHISHGEFEVLLRLFWTPDKRQRIRDLAEASVLTRSGMSRLVERLVQAGLVRREGATEDGRGAYAVLTTVGQERFEAALASNIALVRQRFLNLYSQQELEQMGAFWERFLEHDRKASN
jgi:DNA-binding MarR family transcriptional regulator